MHVHDRPHLGQLCSTYATHTHTHGGVQGFHGVYVKNEISHLHEASRAAAAARIARALRSFSSQVFRPSWRLSPSLQPSLLSSVPPSSVPPFVRPSLVTPPPFSLMVSRAYLRMHARHSAAPKTIWKHWPRAWRRTSLPLSRRPLQVPPPPPPPEEQAAREWSGEGVGPPMWVGRMLMSKEAMIMSKEESRLSNPSGSPLQRTH